jgi:hypothetical protein
MKYMDAASTIPDRGATGPRTAAGKRRSRMNAIKHGFFAKYLLLEGEDPAEYEKLHGDLRNDWQPVGRSEDLEVERLASLYWRQRRSPTAEAALISRSPGFVGTAGRTDLPHQDMLRACLKDGSTPVDPKVALLQFALQELNELAENLSRRGFDFVEDTDKLLGVYGNFMDGTASIPCYKIATLLLESCDRQRTESKSAGATEFVSDAIKVIRAEMTRVVGLIGEEKSKDVLRNSLASLVPPQCDLDRIIRNESHLSREIDRSISRLERIQRARQSRSSSIRVDLES